MFFKTDSSPSELSCIFSLKGALLPLKQFSKQEKSKQQPDDVSSGYRSRLRGWATWAQILKASLKAVWLSSASSSLRAIIGIEYVSNTYFLFSILFLTLKMSVKSFTPESNQYLLSTYHVTSILLDVLLSCCELRGGDFGEKDMARVMPKFQKTGGKVQ